MLHEGPETGACGDPSTTTLGLVCQLRTGPDQQTVLRVDHHPDGGLT